MPRRQPEYSLIRNEKNHDEYVLTLKTKERIMHLRRYHRYYELTRTDETGAVISHRRYHPSFIKDVADLLLAFTQINTPETPLTPGELEITETIDKIPAAVLNLETNQLHYYHISELTKITTLTHQNPQDPENYLETEHRITHRNKVIKIRKKDYQIIHGQLISRGCEIDRHGYIKHPPSSPKNTP